MSKRLLRLVSAVVLALPLLGCGGSSSILDPTDNVASKLPPIVGLESAVTITQGYVNSKVKASNLDLTAVATTNPSIGFNHEDVIGSSFAVSASNREISAAAGFADGMPVVPVDAPQINVEFVRSASAIQPVALETPSQQSASGVTAAAGSLDLAAPADGIAWAIYQVPFTAGQVVNSIQVTGTLNLANNGSDSGLWIGVANYSSLTWGFTSGPSDLTSAATSTRGAGMNWGSSGNNAYVVLLAFNGDIVNIDALNVDITGGGPGPGVLPDAWETAKANTGLTGATMGMRDNPGLPAADMHVDNSIWFREDPARHDLLSKMPTYMMAWAGDPDDGTGGTIDLRGDGFIVPEDFPTYMSDRGQALLSNNSIQDVVVMASSEMQPGNNAGSQTYEAPDPVLNATTPLADAIARFVDEVGGTSDMAAYAAALSGLSLADREILSEVVDSARVAASVRRIIMHGSDGVSGFFGGDNDAGQTWFANSHNGLGIWGPDMDISNMNGNIYVSIPDPGDVGRSISRVRDFSHGLMGAGAGYMSAAIDDLTTYIDTNNPTWASVSLDIDTPAGKIVIAGTGSDTHAIGPDQGSDGISDGHAILIDFGGNDTYNSHAGGTASFMNGVSLCIDFDGDDTYNRIDDPDDVDRTAAPSNDNTSQQGAGRWGIGMLIDYNGTDQYNSVRVSQGCGVWGVGVLADLGMGNDTYTFECMGQGAAMAGLGILIDEGGADEYNGWQFAQGCGSIQGVGWLVDKGSSGDTYEVEVMVDPTKPEYNPFDDTTGRNRNASQGAAVGIAGYISVSDPSSSVMCSGGHGQLFDGGGNDLYTGGNLTQGASQFEGLGMLIDMGGNDTYSAFDRGQAGATTVGVAGLWDEEGDDIYTLPEGQGIGSGRFWSVAWLYDKTGGDTYTSSGFSLGTGSEAGYGYFLDIAGNDTYGPSAASNQNSSLGRGFFEDGVTPTTQPTYGIFVDDGAGTDTYDAQYGGMLGGPDDTTVIPSPPNNNTAWVRGPYADGSTETLFYPLEHGSGLDQ